MNLIKSQGNLKSKKIHFIFVIDAFTKGGAQRNLELVLPEMVKLGAQVDLVLIQDSNEELSLQGLESSGVHIHRIVARNMHDIFGFIRFLKVARKRDSTIVANLFWSQVWSALLIFPKGAQKLFWVEHNTYLNRTGSHWLIYKLLSCRSKSVLAVSSEISDFLQKRVNIKVQLINNAATSFQAREKVQIENFRFLFVGRLVEQKNPLLALEAFKYALDNATVPDNSKLIVIGDGPLRREMETYVCANRLVGIVQFLGYLESEEVSKIMSESQTLVMTSHHEGSPLVRLEALVNGMAIVTTETAGIKGILTTGFSEELLPGIFVSDSNKISLAENLAKSVEFSVWHDVAIESRLKRGKRFSPPEVAKTYFILDED